MKTILYTWFAVLLFGMAAVSCGDDDTKNNDTTGITGSSWKASETVGADRTTKKYTFKASANWVAQSDKPEWCKILTSSGDKGSDRQLNITVEANETGSTRSANITVQVSGYARAAQFAITQLGSSSGGTGADTELNKQVDKILEYYYLWNGEYRQMSRDLSLDYISSSDNFLKRTLLEMTTNDLDKKRQSNGSYSVYSYLLRTPLTKAVDGTKPEVNHGVAKKKEYGFGIAGLMGVRFVDGNNQPTGEYGLVVTSVYPDSPASEAGFRRGTFFAQYNGAAITAANLNSVYGTLIAPGGASTVKLTENKQGAQPVSLTAREIYPNPVIHSEVITSGAHRIGYLVYDSFDAAYDDELLAAVKKLKDGNITDMVLDLRNNGGGLVDTCVKMADLILPEGVVVSMKDKNGNVTEEKIDGEYYDVPMAVLVNGNSASASEIFAGAIKDYGVGTLIGTQTFGKGIVQSLFPLSDGSAIKVTVSRYYTPAGNNIHEVGITPDIILEKDTESEEDNQLQKAIDVLKE